MHRGVVSLLLLPGVLLTQSAALCHGHGGGQHAGHDLRPHIHTNLTPVHHAHDHGSCGHHHHHDDADGAREPAPTPRPASAPDHDSDAVFIPSIDVTPNEQLVVSDERAPSPLWAVLGSGHVAGANPPRESAALAHPPPAAAACPIYIRQLSLLI